MPALVPLYAAHSSIDAHLLKGLLAQAGIEALVLGDLLQGAVGELPPTGFIKVLVFEEDLSAALDILQTFEAKQRGGSRLF